MRNVFPLDVIWGIRGVFNTSLYNEYNDSRNALRDIHEESGARFECVTPMERR